MALEVIGLPLKGCDLLRLFGRLMFWYGLEVA